MKAPTLCAPHGRKRSYPTERGKVIGESFEKWFLGLSAVWERGSVSGSADTVLLLSVRRDLQPAT